MKISKTRREATRVRILAAGIDLFRRRGFHAVGVQEIASAAKIPKGSFYNYFPTKQKFVAAALAAYAGGAASHVKLHLEDPTIPPDEAVARMFKNRIAAEKQLQKRRTACLANMIGQELGGYKAPIRRAADTLWSQMREPLTQALRAVEANGWLNSPMTPQELAEFLENSWRGAMLASRARLDHAPLHAFESYLNTIFRRDD